MTLARLAALFVLLAALSAVRSACAQGESDMEPPGNSAAEAMRALAPRRAETEVISPGVVTPVVGDFPPLPPDPYESDHERLPPLEDELWHHGGSYLYQAEGDQLNWPGKDDAHYDMLRLPETYQKPRPAEGFAEFLGTGLISYSPRLRWPGPDGFSWEPRFVGYGSYSMFGFAFEQNNQRQDVVGHQLVLDLDLQLTGTERFHVQFRPLGQNNTGGSYYQISNPSGYVNNAHAAPDRYWFEGELSSMFGGYVNPFFPLDYHIVAGKFPFALHNSLLMNDEIRGVAINKNTRMPGGISNMNTQFFYGIDDVDSFGGNDNQLIGTHVSIDYRRAFFEATYAFLKHDFGSARDAHYAALSATNWYGQLTLAGRAMFKWGDSGGTGAGQLLVVESSYTQLFDHKPLGVSHGVFYANAFWASRGWNPISDGNFNRLRTSFETNPLVRISAGQGSGDVAGIAGGVQLFRRHEDESVAPEFAFERRDDASVYGVGLRYQRKTGPRSFIEALGLLNFSDDPRFDREGIFVNYTILF